MIFLQLGLKLQGLNINRDKQIFRRPKKKYQCNYENKPSFLQNIGFSSVDYLIFFCILTVKINMSTNLEFLIFVIICRLIDDPFETGIG
jgi:hypothetical protein